MKQSLFLLSALAAFSMTGASSAQTTFNEDVSINGGGTEDQLCVGDNCDNDETYESNKVKIRIKDENTALEFFDVDGQNWMIEANQGTPSLKIGRDTAGPRPFIIDSAAPANALFIGDNGLGAPEIGIGTTLPRTALHIASPRGPSIRLENTSADPEAWIITGGSGSFVVRDAETGKGVLILDKGAPSSSNRVAENGYVGINTSSPDAPLEVNLDNTFSFFRITANDDMNVNQSVDITYTGGPLNTGQLRYNIVDGDNQEMSLDADGNVVIDGTLTTSGPTCAGGCDRVFEAEYALKSITEHQTQMWAQGHLPNVGPTTANTHFNVTDKMGRMLNELEHAHIYIGELHARLAQTEQVTQAVQADLALGQAENAQLHARLTALEARLQQLTAQ